MGTNQHLDTLVKTLESIMHMGYSRHNVLQDFIGLMFYAFQRDDAQYLQIMKQYRNEGVMDAREADYFAHALGELMLAMQETNEEYLGNLFMEFASDSYKGQFFTPYSVCKCMSQMLNVGDKFPKSGKVFINDPCCGAGAMLLSFAQELSIEQANRVVFVAQDIDICCCQMTALNMMFFNMDAVIIHGNTLSLEVRNAWRTRRNIVWGGSLEVMNVEDAKRIIENALKAETHENKSTENKDKDKENLKYKPIIQQKKNFQRINLKPIQLSLI